MNKIALIALALSLAACSQADQTTLDVTTSGSSEVQPQAPLDVALRPRAHGDLIRHFHHPGASYQIHVTPLRVTTIIFQADERVVTIGAGDTERFNVDLTETEGKHALLVKPTTNNIKTNVSVVTDRRVYVLDLIANANTNFVVAFEPYSTDQFEAMPVTTTWPPKPAFRPKSQAAITGEHRS